MNENSNPGSYILNIDQIREYLPHRSPFLLVDRVLEIETQGGLNSLAMDQSRVGSRVVALKNVTYNEPCFQGHFPNYSIFPGVLILEAMAQASSFALYPILRHKDQKQYREFQTILVGLDSVRFRRPVLPGDSLRIESVVTKCRGKLWAFQAEATVDGQKAAEAEIMANIIPMEVDAAITPASALN